jgi:hypothetical protein
MTDDVQRTVGSLAAIATELATLSTNLQTAEVLGQMQADRATLRELLTAARRALAPFAHFARQFARKPLSGMDDAIYGIHTGTEWAAELRRSDCQRAADLLGVIEQTLSPAVQSHQRVPDGAVARQRGAARRRLGPDRRARRRRCAAHRPAPLVQGARRLDGRGAAVVPASIRGRTHQGLSALS